MKGGIGERLSVFLSPCAIGMGVSDTLFPAAPTRYGAFFGRARGRFFASFFVQPHPIFSSSTDGFLLGLLLVSCLQGDGFGPCLGLFFGWLCIRFLCSSARSFCRRWFGCFGRLDGVGRGWTLGGGEPEK